jgi:hypothetical protein
MILNARRIIMIQWRSSSPRRPGNSVPTWWIAPLVVAAALLVAFWAETRMTITSLPN